MTPSRSFDFFPEDPAESEFCNCGVTLMGDPDESDGLCGVCARAPHGRECWCDECMDYWRRIAEESQAAAERFNRQLVCTCGWTGPYIEHHDFDARPGCEVTYRHPEDERQQLVRKVWTGAEWRQREEATT